MSKQLESSHEWNYFFGHRGGSNRKGSQAHKLLHNLATRYSEIRQSEKKLFAKNEVYDVVVNNGGRFLLYNKEKFEDVTDIRNEETVGRILQNIMQNFRDINKSKRNRESEEVAKKAAVANIVGNPQERPIFNSVRYSMQTLVNETARDLPEDSQNSINANLCSRIKRLEMILHSPRQGTETAGNRTLFSRDSQQTMNLDLHTRVKYLEGLVRAKKKCVSVEKQLNENRVESDNSNKTSRLDHSFHANDEGIGESFDAAAGISGNV